MSDPVVEVPTLAQRVDDLWAVLDAASSTSAVVLGYSDGGPTVIQFAVGEHERTRGLVLYGTVSTPPPAEAAQKFRDAARVGYVRRALHLPPANPARLPDSDDQSWMSVSAAANALGVSPDTIRRWAREGSLQARQMMPQAPWRIYVTEDVIACMMPDAPPGWVGLTAAAKALGRAKQTILHWVHSGKLRSVQVRSGKRRGLRIELKRDEIGLFADSN